MRRLIVSAWVTVDGVFDASTMGEWFRPYDSLERQESIRSVVLASDAFLMGRRTYEMLAPHWSKLTKNEEGIAAALNSAPKYVVSSTLETADWNNSTIIRTNVLHEIVALKRRRGQGILIFGSATLVQSLMEADLIDEYRFLVHPIIMGTGKRFFKDGMPATRLKLAKATTLAMGVTLDTYRPV